MARSLSRRTLTYRRLRPPASSPVKFTLTRSFGAASPATKRERRIISGAERDILTWARQIPGRFPKKTSNRDPTSTQGKLLPASFLFTGRQGSPLPEEV
jgi:hypothetical protein